MDIVYKRVNEREIVNLANLITSEVYSRAKRPEVATFASYYKENEKMQGAGLIQFTHKEDHARMEWIYIAKDFRRKKIGTKLYKYALSEEKGNDCVKTEFSDYYLADINAEDAEAFLYSLGFEDNGEYFDTYLVKGRDIFKTDTEKIPDPGAGVICLSGFSPRMMIEAADDFSEDKELFFRADKNTSFLYKKESRRGILLTEKINDSYRIIRFYAKEDAITGELTGALLKSLGKNMRYGDHLRLTEKDLDTIRMNYPVSCSEDHRVCVMANKAGKET